MYSLTCIALLALTFGGASGAGHSDFMPMNPVPGSVIQPPPILPKDYESMRKHEIVKRDHGCQDFPSVDEPYHCIDIFIKNKYSEANIEPKAFLTEFQYHGTNNAWKPAVTWLENVTPKRVRACAAAPGGADGVLSHGKMRWFAVYNESVSAAEQFGRQDISQWKLTGNHYCSHISFPMTFPSSPVLKFTVSANNVNIGQEAMVIWLKGVTNTGAVVCLEEFYAWSRYHHQLHLHWYGIANDHSEDEYSRKGVVSFSASDLYPSDHHNINNYFCRQVRLPTSYYPCPAILLQPEEPSLDICETPLVSWIAHMDAHNMTVCYGDKRGIRNNRVADVRIHYIVYGHQDPCLGISCSNSECVHPEWNTAKCGCVKSCAADTEKACGTNMKTYANKCELLKAACESGNKFEYAHKGECEKFTYDHGREQLSMVAGCSGLYCKVINTRNNIWYPHADVNVQTSVNWGSNMNMQHEHDATASWVEDVTPESFKACVQEAGGRTLTVAPSINWFAYQGEMEQVMSRKIEIGEWREGTHCVPFHERKPLREPMQFKPLTCPKIALKDIHKVEQDKWQYDAHLMSQIYGQTHHEWFKRMLMGYGVQRLNLTSGMAMKDATLMMTVEHHHDDDEKTSANKNQHNGINVWMEVDAATHESYVCVREMRNWAGVHKGYHVYWTLFNNSMIRSLGFSHKMKFKPHYMSNEMHMSGASCQTKKYLPEGMDLVDSATILVSLSHSIPDKSAVDSMKKYELHHMEVKKGSPVGEFDFMKKDVQESWTMPHMWRANLTGWRPHMRIEKNTDYSAWIEGMNNTHVTVCQKSLFTGLHYEGVEVSMFVLPDRCPSGDRLFKDNMCGKYISSPCQNHSRASQMCADMGYYLGVANDCRENVWLSYLAGQNLISIGTNDKVNEGTWVRQSGYSRWAAGQPSNPASDYDCGTQHGRSNDFYEYSADCSNCEKYVCVKAAPFLSCNFRKPGYCNDCGYCERMAPFSYKCDCRPPFGGNRCETKLRIA